MSLPTNAPRLLKSMYLAGGEFLQLETRGTKLFYFPGPAFVLLIFLILTLLTAGAVWSSVPSVPYLTALFGRLPASPYDLRLYAVFFVLFLDILAVLWIFYRYLRWISTVYAVTDHRVIVQRGIFGRDVEQIPVNQVRGVDVHQTAWQRVLGYGTIRVMSEEGTPLGNENWQGIPKPFVLQRTIETAMQNLTQPRVVVQAAPPTYYQPPPPPRRT